jgi:8-amino-7-oxononanoate synthase
MWDAVIDEVDGRRIRVGDHWLVDWASCNYLGFDLDAEIIEAVAATVREWGTHPGWSRMLGSPRLYPEIEEQLPNCCTRRTRWCCRRSARSTWP